MGSESAKALAKELGVLRIYPYSSRYRYKPRHLIINWGCGNTEHLSTIPKEAWLNHPEYVNIAINKIKSLNCFRQADVPHPQFTTNKFIAQHWVEENNVVYCRTLLQGKGGADIVIANSTDSLVTAPLYTLGIKTKTEYRVHVFNGEVVDYVKKARRRGERPSHQIRNYSKGWVFVREGVQLPEACKKASIAAVQALGLHFGAVDVATISDDETEVLVFEVNTACGFKYGSTTCNAYSSAILNYIERI